MMARSTTRSNQRPDTLMQDRSPTGRRRLLRRTAGPTTVSAESPSAHKSFQSQSGLGVGLWQSTDMRRLQSPGLHAALSRLHREGCSGGTLWRGDHRRDRGNYRHVISRERQPSYFVCNAKTPSQSSGGGFSRNARIRSTYKLKSVFNRQSLSMIRPCSIAAKAASQSRLR